MHIAVIIHKQTASSLAFGIIGFVNRPTFVTRHGKLIGVQIFSPLRLLNFQLFAPSHPRTPSRPLGNPRSTLAHRTVIAAMRARYTCILMHANRRGRRRFSAADRFRVAIII